MTMRITIFRKFRKAIEFRLFLLMVWYLHYSWLSS